jgi:uncharacterized protein
MPVRVNLRLLERKPEHLEGELPAAELVTGFRDELIRFVEPVRYDLEVSVEEGGVLVMGPVSTELECDCSRCLRTFRQTLELPGFAVLVPLAGEDALKPDGDFADLTGFLREDIYLALPTNPLCDPECRGLAPKAEARDLRLETPSASAGPGSPWETLDKLKL